MKLKSLWPVRRDDLFCLFFCSCVFLKALRKRQHLGRIRDTISVTEGDRNHQPVNRPHQMIGDQAARLTRNGDLANVERVHVTGEERRDVSDHSPALCPINIVGVSRLHVVDDATHVGEEIPLGSIGKRLAHRFKVTDEIDERIDVNGCHRGRFIRLRNGFETPPEMSMIEVRDVIRGMMRIEFSQQNSVLVQRQRLAI